MFLLNSLNVFIIPTVVSSTVWPTSNYIYCLNRNSLQFTEGSTEGRKWAVIWSTKAPVY